jgi:hypothetical protein
MGAAIIPTLRACSGFAQGISGRSKANDTNNASGQAPIHTGAQIHMLILALDYPGTGHELTCTEDGNNMFKLAKRCGVQDIVKLWNNEAHYEAVERAIRDMGKRCDTGDYFVFNYSGHGANVQDKDGDEEDGQDEALCLVTPDGKLDFERFMTDDDFARIITESVERDVNILIMCDCCHSGTIGDFENEEWDGFRALSMSGCKDSQTSGDTGRGGIWTHSLLLAIEELHDEGEDDYSIGQLYNIQLDKDDEVFNSKQDIQIKWTSDLGGPEDMAWPFVPPGEFTAPWNER